MACKDPEARRAYHREYNRAWRELHREKLRKKAREYKRRLRAANPEKSREYEREWRAANPGYHREWRAANPEKCREALRKWRVANPEKCREHDRRRRALKRATTVEKFDEPEKAPCYLCGGPPEHLDHIVPLSRGGTHTPDNVAWACAPCNLSKGSKTLEEYQNG